MKVIYVSNKILSSQQGLNWFQFYCDTIEDLHIFKNTSAAIKFLTNEIINKQKHVDFIVMDWQFKTNNARSLLNWLRESQNNYSTNNFQLRKIPIILVEDTVQQSKAITEGFDSVITDFPADKYKLRKAVKDAIKTWRYALADDLDLIGLDPQTQKIYSMHRSSFLSYYKLKILTRSFVDAKSKKLNYLWTTSDIKNISQASSSFYDKINHTIKFPPKYLEKEFHDLFNKHPTLIKGEDFRKDEMLYEKHFYKNGTRKYDEPDFINKPYEFSLNKPEIFEIKRQSQRLLTYSNDRFLFNAKKSFQQVKRYKDYMTSDNPQHQYYIKYHLGQLYDSYNFTLLMGSKNEKEEHEDLISRLKSDFEFEDINLITYEELLDKHIKMCDRLEEFNIFS